MSKKLIAGAGVVASFAVALAPLATFAASYYPNTHKDTLNVTIEEVCSFGHTYSDNTTVIKPGTHNDGTGSGAVEDVPSNNIDAGKGYGKWLDASGDPVTDASAYDTAESYQRNVGNPATATDWPAAPTSPVAEVADTAYGVMETGTFNNAFAHTTLAVICNTDAGYQIKTSTPDPLERTSGDTTPIAFDGDYAMTAATDSAWNFYVTDVTTTDTSAAAASAHGTGQTAGNMNKKSAYTTDLPNDKVIVGGAGATTRLGDRWKITYGVSVKSEQGAGTYQGSIVYTLVQL